MINNIDYNEYTKLKINQLLRDVFNYDKFNGKQEEIILHILSGENIFIVMPPGEGKSLCYQLPAVINENMAVIITSLNHYMVEQVNFLVEIGIDASYLNSSMDENDFNKTIKLIKQNNIKILYISPERLQMDKTLNLLDYCKISFFVIDDAHCISKWGHDFRPDYLHLDILNKHFPNVQRIAITSNVDNLTQEEIINHLSLDKGTISKTDFFRPNIRYEIQKSLKPKEQLLNFLKNKHKNDSGVIYCRNRKQTEEIVYFLKNEGWNAYPYHMGMDKFTRFKNLNIFKTDDDVVIVSTIGSNIYINKPNLRFTVHMNLTTNIESYYQETGRAGRDGKSCDALLLFDYDDINWIESNINQSFADNIYKNTEINKLYKFIDFCQSTNCRNQIISAYFGRSKFEPCGNCDNCLKKWYSKLTVRKALYCVLKTGERFGVSHLCDILVGNITSKVTQYKHDKISAFGNGIEVDINEWKNIFAELVKLEYLKIDESYKGLSLTLKGKESLKYESTILLKKNNIITSTTINSNFISNSTKNNIRRINPLEEWDATLSVRKALYCIYQTEQSGLHFGAKHLTDILIGKTTQQIIKFKHDKLSAFGNGNENSEKLWISIFYQLVRMGYLEIDTLYKGLKLTASAQLVLEKKQSVILHIDSITQIITDSDSDIDDKFYKELMTWRDSIKEKIKDTSIFADSILHKIIKDHPRSVDELEDIIGMTYSSRFGKDIIEIVQKYPRTIYKIKPNKQK